MPNKRKITKTMYNRVHSLRRQGHKTSYIVDAVGLSRVTVMGLAQAPSYEEFYVIRRKQENERAARKRAKAVHTVPVGQEKVPVIKPTREVSVAPYRRAYKTGKVVDVNGYKKNQPSKYSVPDLPKAVARPVKSKQPGIGNVILQELREFRAEVQPKQSALSRFLAIFK